MCKIVWIIAVLLLPLLAQATTGYAASVNSPYFNVSFQDYWQLEGHPTMQEELRDVTSFWQYAIRAHRSIQCRSRIHSALTVKPLGTILDEFSPPPSNFKRALAAHGLTDRELARESVRLYTIQLAAYQKRSSLRHFLRHLTKGDQLIDGWVGPNIYRKTPKHFQFNYGDDTCDFKYEPLYLQREQSFTRLRYGMYENRGDARCDAIVWEKHFHVKPIVVSVPLNQSLVQAVLWGELPGVYRPQYLIR